MLAEKRDSVIAHKGRVLDVFEKGVDVSILSESACASCKVKSACGMSESKEKIVTVMTPHAAAYEPGEEVTVSIQQHMGTKAILYVYVIPLFTVLIALVVMTQLGVSDGISGGVALGTLAVYYFILYLLRDRIERDIHFEIQKSTNNQP